MKRKATRSTEHSESSSKLHDDGQGILYEEASGKTVDFIRYVEDLSGPPAFEIRFTDGTFVFIEPVPRVEFRVRLLKARRGNVKTVRDDGATEQ